MILGSGQSWRRARAQDRIPLERFLGNEERRCLAISDHLRPDPTFPPRMGSSFCLLLNGGENGEVAGAALLREDVNLWAILPRDTSADGLLGTAVRSWIKACLGTDGAPRHIVGTTPDVGRISRCLPVPPAGRREYRLLFRDARPAEAAPGVPGLAVRRARLGDFAAVLELHAAYELEEVNPSRGGRPGEKPVDRVRDLLERREVWVAELGSALVAKANINASGFASDQIGGVYVDPGFRRRGIGGAVVGALVGSIARSGRSTALFVKPENLEALAVYRRLGFVDAGGYCVEDR